jgi:hypothetical protein
VEYWFGSFPPQIAMFSRDTIGFSMAVSGAANTVST